jgi:hypothetical protein
LYPHFLVSKEEEKEAEKQREEREREKTTRVGELLINPSYIFIQCRKCSQKEHPR